jgi:hypothetical protein
MKNLKAAFIPVENIVNGMDVVPALLNNEPKQYIDNLLWSVNGYKPEVSFAIAYTADSILLKYYVTEEHIKATYREINDPVFKDTCVEFFVAFDGEDKYYNLEFNCIGTPLIAYGSGKNDRVYLDRPVIELIETHHYIADSDIEDLYYWELTLRIPFTVFVHHRISSLQNEECKANFFKCGDDLPKPHFLSWNNIEHAEPNFHLPQFFGSIAFA